MKNNNLKGIIIYVFFSCFIGMICGASFIMSLNTNNDEIINNDEDELYEVSRMYNKIKDEYYTSVDNSTLIEAAINGMLSVLDKNTGYLNETSTSSFNEKMNGEYKGIGIETLTLENVGLLVMTVLDDSVAYRCGIKEGDIIISVNNIDFTKNKSLYFKEYISKLEDEFVIRLLRDDKEIEYTLKSDIITIDSVSGQVFSKYGKNIGYIKIDIFALNTATQFCNILSNLEKLNIDSLIIDVRNNAGGYLSTVSTILEMFMEKGTILYKIDNKNIISDKVDSTDESRSYPVNILINESSASASEILAASFKDNYNSNLIGTRTYGKGTIQELINVSDGSMAKLTTKKWLTPNEEWINEIGISPTIEVKINDGFYEKQDIENDNQLSAAIELLKD